MDHWQRDFLQRMNHFSTGHNAPGIALSVKVRATSGCFCPSCCPEAHRIINQYRANHPLNQCAEFVEHESGPEILICLALLTAKLVLAKEAVSLIKSVVELVTTVVNARSDGRKNGDKRDEPLVIIVRGFSEGGAFYEHEILEVDTAKMLDTTTIKEKLTSAITVIAKDQSGNEKASKGKHKPKTAQRKPTNPKKRKR